MYITTTLHQILPNLILSRTRGRRLHPSSSSTPRRRYLSSSATSRRLSFSAPSLPPTTSPLPLPPATQLSLLLLHYGAPKPHPSPPRVEPHGRTLTRGRSCAVTSHDVVALPALSARARARSSSDLTLLPPLSCLYRWRGRRRRLRQQAVPTYAMSSSSAALAKSIPSLPALRNHAPQTLSGYWIPLPIYMFFVRIVLPLPIFWFESDPITSIY